MPEAETRQDDATGFVPMGAYLTAFLAPFVALALGRLSPRDRWRHQRHRVRWERRYGKPYPTIEGKIGRYGGVSFVGPDA